MYLNQLDDHALNGLRLIGFNFLVQMATNVVLFYKNVPLELRNTLHYVPMLTWDTYIAAIYNINYYEYRSVISRLLDYSNMSTFMEESEDDYLTIFQRIDRLNTIGKLMVLEHELNSTIPFGGDATTFNTDNDVEEEDEEDEEEEEEEGEQEDEQVEKHNSVSGKKKFVDRLVEEEENEKEEQDEEEEEEEEQGELVEESEEEGMEEEDEYENIEEEKLPQQKKYNKNAVIERACT